MECAVVRDIPLGPRRAGASGVGGSRKPEDRNQQAEKREDEDAPCRLYCGIPRVCVAMLFCFWCDAKEQSTRQTAAHEFAHRIHAACALPTGDRGVETPFGSEAAEGFNPARDRNM